MEIIITHKERKVYIYPLGENARLRCIKLADELRMLGITAILSLNNKSLKGAMRQADKMAVSDFIMIGDNEIKKNVVTWKNMETGEQREIKKQELLERLDYGEKIQISVAEV